MTTTEQDWLTVAEACAYLRVTRATLYRWAREGKLPMYRLGHRTTRLRRSEVDALMTRKNSEPYVTVVGLAKSDIFKIGPAMRSVRDAVARFTADPQSNVIFLNQQPCDDLDRPLDDRDILVVLPKAFENGSGGMADEMREDRAWLKLAESAFAKDWDNPQDAIYDNWKELYGVRDR